jgi:GT2 family glycosyltransferase
MADFSIIMLSRGRAEYTRAALAALAQTLPPRCQVILVDDGTEDASVQDVFNEFKRAHPRLKADVLRFQQSVGAVRCRNEAVKAAAGRYLALLDNDCIARTRNWLVALRNVFNRYEDAGVAGVRLVYPLRSAGMMPTIQCAGCTVTLSGRVGFRGRGEAADGVHFAAEEPVQAVISACCLTPRDLWNAVGGMDEAFSPCQFEDIDYCYRVRQMGRKVIYTPAAEMYHFENVTSGGLASVSYAALTARNSVKFAGKWREFLEMEGAPKPDTVTWRTDIPVIRLEDRPVLELIDAPPI